MRVPSKLVPKWCHYITLEPSVVFYFITENILEFANTNLYLQKSCRNNATTEVHLDTPCDDEKRGILFVSSIESSSRYILYSLQFVYLIAASRWSDLAGKKRKPLILLPILGQILQAIFSCLHSYFWYWDPVFAVASNVFFQLAFGGYCLCLNMCSTYLSDLSDEKDRTMRLGILSALEALCIPIASASAGWLLRRFGFFYTYLACLISTTLAMMLGCFLIKDTAVPVENPASLVSVFNPMSLVDSFKVMFQKRLARKRIIVVLLILVHVFVWFPHNGEVTVLYLYFRYKFHWEQDQYAYFYAYKVFGSVIGLLFFTVVLSKYWKIHDGILGTIAAFLDAIASLAYMFAEEEWQLYLIPILGMLRATAISVHYPYISKFYESSEFGRLTAALNFFSLIIPLTFPLYGKVFIATMDIFPSTFFGLSFAFNLTVSILYSASYYWCKKLE